MEVVNNFRTKLDIFFNKKVEPRKIVHAITSFFLAVFAVGSLVGWVFSFSVFKLFNPEWVTMTIGSSIVFTCFLLVIVKREYEYIWAGGILVMAFYYSILTAHSIEYVVSNPLQQDYLALPSTGDIIAFYCIFLAIAFDKKREMFSLITVMIGFTAMVGYLISEPLLYYKIGPYKPMPLHNAVLLFMVGLWLYGDNDRVEHVKINLPEYLVPTLPIFYIFFLKHNYTKMKNNLYPNVLKKGIIMMLFLCAAFMSANGQDTSVAKDATETLTAPTVHQAAPVTSVAQAAPADTTIIDSSTLDKVTEELLNARNTMYYSLLVLLIGFAQRFIPIPEKFITSVGARVLTMAIVIGVAAVQYGFIEYWQIYAGWLLSVAGYTLGLKPAGIVTPKSALQKQLSDA